ncbi:MAG: Gfo/Idh/MocA family oxidoreductase [Clostridia bacterium]
MSNMKYRHVTIGAGGVALYKHIPGYMGLGNVQVCAAYDPSAGALANLKGKFPSINTYSDYEEMLCKETPDIASVCSPNKFHRDYAVDLLGRGIHVHLEKPIAMNEQEAGDIIRAKDSSTALLMLGLNNRFTNEACFVRDYICSGGLGEIYYVRCGWRRRRNIPSLGSWFTRKDLSGGGPLIDLGVHFIDLTLHFMGYPEALSVSASTYRKFGGCKSKNQRKADVPEAGDYDVEDLALGFIRLDNGATMAYEFSYALNTEKEEYFYEMFGTRGGVTFHSGQLKIYSEINDTVVDITPVTNYPKPEINEFKHFIDAIEGKAALLAPPEEGKKMMAIIDAAYRSAEMKKEVVLT